MTTFQPHLPAARVDLLLKQSLQELQQVEKGAVLWFAEILNRKLYRELGYSSMQQYAELELGFGRVRTAQFIRLAGSLKDLPELRSSLARGDVSWTKAREVARVATPKTERAWIRRARGSTSRDLERSIQETRRAARGIRAGAQQAGFMDGNGAAADAAGDPLGLAPSSSGAPSPAGDTTAVSRGDTGLALAADVPVDLHLRFTPTQYARYEALMEKVRKAGRHGSREEVLLAALETAVLSGRVSRSEAVTSAACQKAERHGRHAESTAAPGGGTTAAHGAESTAAPGEEHAQLESEGVPRGTPSPYQVVVQVCEHCGTGSVETGRGRRALAPEALKAILCDARIRRRGERNRAAVPAVLRRRVLERDRFRCRAAGCSRTQFLSVHHLVPREAGGKNRIENLVTLCEGCHRAAHHGAHRAGGALIGHRDPDIGGGRSPNRRPSSDIRGDPHRTPDPHQTSGVDPYRSRRVIGHRGGAYRARDVHRVFPCLGPRGSEMPPGTLRAAPKARFPAPRTSPTLPASDPARPGSAP